MMEAIGWLATAVFSTSYFFRRAAALRRIQAFAACLWIAYGLRPSDALPRRNSQTWWWPPRPCIRPFAAKPAAPPRTNWLMPYSFGNEMQTDFQEQPEGLPAGQRLRPDPEFQRFGDRAERPVGGREFCRTDRRPFPDPPRATGRRTGLPAAARPGIPRVRREHLVEVGKRIRLKQNIRMLSELLQDRRPPLLVLRGLRGAAGSDSIGARRYRSGGPHFRHAVPLRPTQRRNPVHRARAGRATARWRWWMSCAPPGAQPDRIVYVGDGSSDVHVMMHVNRMCGPHHRRLGEPLHHPDCGAHGAQRRRLERAGAGVRRHRGLEPGARIRAFFAAHGLDGARLGQGRAPIP